MNAWHSPGGNTSHLPGMISVGVVVLVGVAGGMDVGAAWIRYPEFKKKTTMENRVN